MAATLADITCDSDGKLDRFVSAREGVDYDPILPLHELQPGQKYYLAMFLTGVRLLAPTTWAPCTLMNYVPRYLEAAPRRAPPLVYCITHWGGTDPFVTWNAM